MTNRVIAGVCGGIAEYLQVDATLVRVFFVIAAVATAGLGFLAYLVLLVLMPLPGRPVPFVRREVPWSAAVDERGPGEAAPDPTGPAAPPTDPDAADRRRAAFGYILFALGVVLLAGTAGLFSYVNWRVVWPLVLIGIGVLLLAQRARR